MASLLRNFANLTSAHEYLQKQGFSRIAPDRWIDASQLIDAQITPTRDGYRVDYFA